jgi:hypothetical protein
MSFEDNSIKPKLVEPKMLKMLAKYQESQAPVSNKIGKQIGQFCYDNIIPIVIIFFVAVLLIHRYYEVKNKKKNNQKEKNN